jgi:hypothetical protein
VGGAAVGPVVGRQPICPGAEHDCDVLSAELDPEPWLGHIRLAGPVAVLVDSDPGAEFSGQVEQGARAAGFNRRYVQTGGERIKQVFGIKVRLATGEGRLRVDMAVNPSRPGPRLISLAVRH